MALWPKKYDSYQYTKGYSSISINRRFADVSQSEETPNVLLHGIWSCSNGRVDEYSGAGFLKSDTHPVVRKGLTL